MFRPTTATTAATTTTTTTTTGTGPPSATSLRPDAVSQLRPLLRTAAHLDLDDEMGWSRLRSVARTTLAGLTAGGGLPTWIAVGEQDPPVVIQRLLAAAWSHATAAPRRDASGFRDASRRSGRPSPQR